MKISAGGVSGHRTRASNQAVNLKKNGRLSRCSTGADGDKKARIIALSSWRRNSKASLFGNPRRGL